MALVLASGSAARARLLEAAGVAFSRCPAAIDEEEIKTALHAEGVPPGEAATTLAEIKALRVSATYGPGSGTIVLGADQLLTCEDRWFDNPPDRAAAKAQLQALSGRRHDLWSAAVAVRDGERIWHAVAEARLWMRPLSESFLDAYLDSALDLVVNSVGAYQIEGLGAQLFTRVQGDPFTVQGLPLLDVLTFLRTQGLLPT